MRLFVALLPDKEVQKELARLQVELKSIIPRANHTLLQNLHSTIRFIGETPPEKINGIHMALRSAAGESAPFVMHLDRIGYFGKPSDATLWCGLEGDVYSFTRLCNKVNAELCKHGWPKEDKPTIPHITLARRADLREVQKIKIEASPIQCRFMSLTLFQSERLCGTLKYINIAEFGLTGCSHDE